MVDQVRDVVDRAKSPGDRLWNVVVVFREAVVRVPDLVGTRDLLVDRCCDLVDRQQSSVVHVRKSAGQVSASVDYVRKLADEVKRSVDQIRNRSGAAATCAGQISLYVLAPGTSAEAVPTHTVTLYTRNIRVPSRFPYRPHNNRTARWDEPIAPE